MNLFDKIVRIPNNLGEDIELEKYYSTNSARDKIYGLSIFSKGATEWKSHVGTLPFLYGIYVNFIHSNDIVGEINNLLIKEKIDLDNDFYGYVFFNINAFNKPVNIIKSFKIIRDIGFDFLFKSNEVKYIIIGCMSLLYDQYNSDEEEYCRLPELIFKI